MTTTADMLLKIAECLLVPRYSAATGGSSTTLTDTTLDEPQGLFDGGTIWFISGALAGKTARITSWSGHVFNFAAQSSAVVAGVQYAVVDDRYPRDEMIGCLNIALDELGPFDQTNTGLTTIGEQTEYTLPAGVHDVKRLQYSLETVAPFHYAPPDYWWEEKNGTLYVSPTKIWTAGANMRLWHEYPHAKVYADTDIITDAVHPRRLAWTAALAVVRNRLFRADTTDEQTAALKKECEQQALALQLEHPIRRMPRDPHWNDLP